MLGFFIFIFCVPCSVFSKVCSPFLLPPVSSSFLLRFYFSFYLFYVCVCVCSGSLSVNLLSLPQMIAFLLCIEMAKFWVSIVFILIIALLMGVSWYLGVLLICIFLMIGNVEHLSCAYWPFICIPYLENYLEFFVQFLNGLFVLWLSCRSCLNILDVNPFAGIWSANVVSHSVCCFFTLFRVSFEAGSF